MWEGICGNQEREWTRRLHGSSGNWFKMCQEESELYLRQELSPSCNLVITIWSLIGWFSLTLMKHYHKRSLDWKRGMVPANMDKWWWRSKQFWDTVNRLGLINPINQVLLISPFKSKTHAYLKNGTKINLGFNKVLILYSFGDIQFLRL